MRRLRILVPLALLAFGPVACPGDDVPTTPNLMQDSFLTANSEQVNPWAGVDLSGNIHGLTSFQLAVDDQGNIHNTNFGPGIAFGDLRGTGLLDLVLADPMGFFWFYPNTGTKTKPVYTTGEVMPVWLGAALAPPNYQGPPINNTGGVVNHCVPLIQLIDINGDGKLDLVAGNASGALFYIFNQGSVNAPMFTTPTDKSQLQDISLRTGHLLDCNFLSPFLYDWNKTGVFSLLRGEGTYSSNSVFLFTNRGANMRPNFNEQNETNIIPGEGREHLTPFVVDWNNDGKPDVLVGEQTGQIEVFLNTTPGGAGHPTFDNGQVVKIGGKDSFGGFTVPVMAPLSGNPKVPDLIFSNDSGLVFYCHNTGAPGNFQFNSPPQPLTGTKGALPTITVSDKWAFGNWNNIDRFPLHGWNEGSPYGVPYELLTVTNAQKEPGFAPPKEVAWKNSLHYFISHHANQYFPATFYPKDETNYEQHFISYVDRVSLVSETPYQLSFWIKGNGLHDVLWSMRGNQYLHPGTANHAAKAVEPGNSISIGPTWSHVTDTVTWDSTNGIQHDTLAFLLNFRFYGQGNLYLADVEIHKQP